MDLVPGTLLKERYHVEERLSSGGFGVVFRAVDTTLRSVVAVKQLALSGANAAAAASSAELRQSLARQFEREAQILAGLRHPALPKVFDHFFEGENQFLVMEFIPGPSLLDMVQEGGPQPLEQVAGWALALIDALDYLHTRQPPVIHRDVKPENLKLTDRGEIILLDFGIAKGATGADQASLTSTSSLIAAASPHYAPIEQIQGTGTEPRSDIYALGATLYHLLSGAPPAPALHRAAAALSQQPDPVAPLHNLVPAVPAAVSEVVMQAMAHGQDERFRNARAMGQALRRALGVPTTPLVASPSPTAATTLSQARVGAAPPAHAPATPPLQLPPPTMAAAPLAAAPQTAPAVPPALAPRPGGGEPLARRKPQTTFSLASCLIGIVVLVVVTALLIGGLTGMVAGSVDGFLQTLTR